MKNILERYFRLHGLSQTSWAMTLLAAAERGHFTDEEMEYPMWPMVPAQGIPGFPWNDTFLTAVRAQDIPTAAVAYVRLETLVLEEFRRTQAQWKAEEEKRKHERTQRY